MELIWASQFVMLLTLLFIGSGSALHIAVSPHTYTEKSVGSVNVTCSLDGTDAGVKTIMLLEILRNGGHPMTILQVTGLTYGVEYSDPDKFQAEGLLDTDVANSYLRLSIHNPNEADDAKYTCKLFYLDSHGMLTEHRASGNLTVEKLDINAAVRDLLDEVAALKQRNSVLEKTLQDQTTKVREFKEVNINQSMEMALMAEEAAYTITFSASLEKNVNLTPGDVVVFGDVQLNHGNAYDATTGIFTAPRNGVYAFNLVLRTSCSSGYYASAHLRAGNINVASVESRNDYEQAGTGVVCELKKGNKVRAVSWTTSKVWGSSTYKLSAFSGHLVK